MGKAAAMIIAVALAGCCPAPPRPIIVETVRNVVVPIPAKLLEEHPAAVGPLSQCPSVASERRAALELCNSQLRAIGTLGDD